MKIKNREDIKKSIVEVCKNKLLKKIQKKINKGLNPLDSYDQVIKGYELEEEIIIIYEMKAKEANLTKKLDLRPEEIDSIKKKIEKNLFKVILKDFNHSDT
ncbi:MAG: hypothetical protein ACFFAN_10340 [Promethearchaeota archaeon]